MAEVVTNVRLLGRFEPVVGGRLLDGTPQVARAVSDRLQGRVVWNVNSMVAGGDVAQMQRPLVAYLRGVGVDARWLVVEGTPDFFRVTKRLHYALHGSPGDGSELDERAHEIYRATMRANLARLGPLVRPWDIVILHDPQTAGLADGLIRRGALVIWRCLIGNDTMIPQAESGWRFLHPYLRNVRSFVFSRRAYLPDSADHGKVGIITPSIEAFAVKNESLDKETVRAILRQARPMNGDKQRRVPLREWNSQDSSCEVPISMLVDLGGRGVLVMICSRLRGGYGHVAAIVALSGREHDRATDGENQLVVLVEQTRVSVDDTAVGLRPRVAHPGAFAPEEDRVARA